MTTPRISVKIENIVSTVTLDQTLDLYAIERSIPGVEYNPEQFPGLVLGIKKPKSKVLVFSSGNIVCTGTKSVQEVKKVIKEVMKHLRKIGVKVREVPPITVQNIVASGSIPMTLNLNELALLLENTEYEPEQFPGLVYKLGNATFLLFSNGKLVCTGTKNRPQLLEAMQQLLRNLRAVKRGR